MKKKNDYEYEELITIMIPDNPAVIPIVKSLLEGADIPYFAKNERIQNLFTIGEIGTGYNLLTGPIEIQVPKKYAEEATQLLAELIKK